MNRPQIFVLASSAITCAALALQGAMPPFAALLLGLVVARTAGGPRWSATAARRLLEVSVIALGCGVDLVALLEVGGDGLLLTAVTLALTFGLGLAVGRWWGLPLNLVLLITAGTAICGGSAVAAIAPLLRARASEIGTALAAIFCLNALALLLFPLIGGALELSDHSFGLWCAIAIHDTSSVVGAAVTQSQQALEVATVTKLARAAWIVPVGFVMAQMLRARGGDARSAAGPDAAPLSRPPVPWFLVGFVAASALVWALPALRPVAEVVAEGSTVGMVLALFCVGLSLAGTRFGATEMRALKFAGLLWLTLAALSLPALLTLAE